MLPKHTPFDGSSHPFGIGLRPLDLKNWIEVDEHLPRYLAEKRRLISAIPEKVWAGDFASETAQQEVLDVLVQHVLEYFPEIYSRQGNVISIAGVGDVDLDDITNPPLQIAALLVQEDLVLMRKTPQGWRLVAASLCFPSSWILREKIGMVMHDVHAPVPGFEEGTRQAMMIERIFDNLQVGLPAERFNWSVYSDDELYHADRAGGHFPDRASSTSDYYLRVEHQTLMKLRRTGDILFTVRIHIDPLAALAHREDRKQLGAAFVHSIETLTHDQAKYKGLEDHRQELINRISKVTQGI